MDHVFDVAIIGGGINGCGCAADAALRGLSVVLFEQDDLASKTSSKSTKLVHGGLRYLEYFDFTLVKKALDERQRLLELAPHLVHSQAFVIPHQKGMRPSWLIRLGLFLYDHLSLSNKLPHSKLLSRKQQPACFTPLIPSVEKGFIYYDGATDDARLTIANALQAKKHGATILTQTKLIKADVTDEQWQLTLETTNGELFKIRAKSVINTAGPWVESVSKLLHTPMHQAISLVKGSHLVIPKLYEGDHAYMLQHNDKRIVFVIPYNNLTLVGTTDIAFSGHLDNIEIEPSEITYLCEIINQYFNKKIQETDVISTWSGIRPLLANPGKKPSALSRDYIYHYANRPAPSITVYGGKITTYRQLALQVVDQLRVIFPNLSSSSTDANPLPGATFDSMSFKAYEIYAEQKYHWLNKETRERYLQTYGALTEVILKGCQREEDLGLCFGSTLYQVEVDYLLREEWACNCEDILWRRTKLGLAIDAKGMRALADYLIKVHVPNSPDCATRAHPGYA